MFSVEVGISEFDYEKTFVNLFPLAMEKLNTLNPEDTGVMLLQRLGSTSLDMLTGTIKRLSEEQRNTLYCQLVNSNRESIMSAINQATSSHEIGKNIGIGGLWMMVRENRLYLLVEDVRMDYKALVKNDKVVDYLGGKLFLAKLALTISEQKAERLVMSSIEKKRQGQLLKYMNAVIAEAGVCAHISSIRLLEPERMPNPDNAHSNAILTEEQWLLIVDAFADYLNGT